MNVLNWLSQRRKAIIALVVGILGLIALYLQLSGDGTFSQQDLSTFIGAVVGVLVTVFGVHQASNIQTIE